MKKTIPASQKKRRVERVNFKKRIPFNLKLDKKKKQRKKTGISIKDEILKSGQTFKKK